MNHLRELQDCVQDMDCNVFYSAEQTDRYDVGYWNTNALDGINEENLLSIRVFNKDKEVRLSRSDIGQTFTLRVVDDRSDSRDHYDEWQILDKDDRRSNGTHFMATGGGSYEFPLTELKHPAVKIRYYLESKTGDGESGLTYVCDWRCVTFGEMGE